MQIGTLLSAGVVAVIIGVALFAIISVIGVSVIISHKRILKRAETGDKQRDMYEEYIGTDINVMLKKVGIDPTEYIRECRIASIEPNFYSLVICRIIGIVFLLAAVALILTGCMLYVSDRMTPGTKNVGGMTLLDALIVGLCQCVAVIPGLSRSGTTITAGISTGLNREFAVKFAFLMSIPAVLGANLLSLIDAIRDGVDWSCVPAYLVGMAVAAVSGIASIRLLNYVAKKGRFGGFAYYCWVVGLLAIILTFIF